MANMAQLAAEKFLGQFFSQQTPPTHGRPRVTLTFAQSLDGKIAGPGSAAVAISGHDSLVMTHVLRTLHDAILVGVGTVLSDNPNLNVRHLDTVPPVGDFPVPVVLDSSFRIPLTCKLLLNAAKGSGVAPLILGRKPGTEEESTRTKKLAAAGAQTLWPEQESSKSRWPTTLRLLHKNHVQSVMVEGGAQVISSLLEASHEGQVEVNWIIITIGKTMVGHDGVSYSAPSGALDNFEHVASQEFGNDTVVVLKAKESST